MWLVILLIVVMSTCLASLYGQGLWGAAITFFNVTTSAMLATVLYEPAAGMLGEGNGWDFTALWALFAALMFLLRLATDVASRRRVRFVKPVDLGGGILFALLTGWVMLCFSMMSLHVSPMPRTALDEAFMPEPDAKMLSVGPDRLWLAFIHRQSRDAFSRGDDHVFDPDGEFVFKYAARRAKAEKKEAPVAPRKR